jgi:excinuclease UvrABC nuclease subunit
LENEAIKISSECLLKMKLVNDYPEIPIAKEVASATGENLPYASGIYFLWSGQRIEYVGQAKYLCNRVILGRHHVLKESHMISYVLISRTYLTWAENYYIGIIRPQLNYGLNASHNRPEA